MTTQQSRAGKLLRQFDEAALSGPSISDFTPVYNWMVKAYDVAMDKFGEDEALWKAWEQKMTQYVSPESLKVFQQQPSADSMHYHSNGRPDGGKIKTFLDEFDDFKKGFEATIAKVN